MLAAKQGAHDEAGALELGADDYVTKPFSFVVLVARLRALIRRATGHGGLPTALHRDVRRVIRRRARDLET